MSNLVFNEMAMEILGVFCRDFGASHYGREVARRLKANQRTVSIHLNRLESAGVLKSRMRGRLKEFYFNRGGIVAEKAVFAAEVYKFCRLAEDFEVSSIVGDAVKMTDGVVVVFGSFAKGYASKGSDLDLLIIGKVDKEGVKGLRKRYSKEVQVMEISEREFLRGLKKRSDFMLEVSENHVVCQGFEKFTRMILDGTA